MKILYFFKEKINITASDLNKKFLTIYSQFEPQYIKSLSVDIYLNKNKLGSLGFSIENSVIKHQKNTELIGRIGYQEGVNLICDNNSPENFAKTLIGLCDLQIAAPIVKLLFFLYKPINEGGEIELVGELNTLSNFDSSKFKFAILEEPEHYTPYVYRISKYVN